MVEAAITQSGCEVTPWIDEAEEVVHSPSQASHRDTKASGELSPSFQATQAQGSQVQDAKQLPSAAATAAYSPMRTLSMTALPLADRLPVSLLNYVSRTLYPKILQNARQDPHFGRDPYIQACKPYSVLMMPLFVRGKFTQCLYLENNLTKV